MAGGRSACSGAAQRAAMPGTWQRCVQRGQTTLGGPRGACSDERHTLRRGLLERKRVYFSGLRGFLFRCVGLEGGGFLFFNFWVGRGPLQEADPHGSLCVFLELFLRIVLGSTRHMCMTGVKSVESACVSRAPRKLS